MIGRLHRRFALLVALALAAGAAGAETDQVIYPRSSAAPAPTTPGLGSSGTFSVVAILLVAGAGAWVLWRGRGKQVAGMAGAQLAIAETRSLGNRQYLVVACYEKKRYLLGVCPGRIDLLAPLDAPADPRKPS